MRTKNTPTSAAAARSHAARRSHAAARSQTAARSQAAAPAKAAAPSQAEAPAPPVARSTLQIDAARVRVTEYRFPPDATTGWHRHEFDYVVVPLVDGRLRIRDAGGERTVELRAGGSYARAAGVEHEVINPGPGEFAFVEIELKG